MSVSNRSIWIWNGTLMLHEEEGCWPLSGRVKRNFPVSLERVKIFNPELYKEALRLLAEWEAKPKS
jgi:hypothetical protein